MHRLRQQQRAVSSLLSQSSYSPLLLLQQARRQQPRVLRSVHPTSCSPTCLTTHPHRVFATQPTTSPRTTYLVQPPKGMLTVTQLEQAAATEEIDTVVVGFTNIYGQLLGKRFDTDFYLSSCHKDGTHACDYLLANDIEQNPTPGYKTINYENGYGDVHLVPDTNSLRLATWQDSTAMVVCDVYDNKTHQLHPMAPRSILRKQIDKASAMGYACMAASELEYYQYETDFRTAHKANWQQSLIQPVSTYMEDYHLQTTATEEKYTAVFRHHLKHSGIPVENSKGEAGLGQHELNISYSDILQMSDRHAVYKQALKEMAQQLGISLTFMAKPFTDATGSGCHIHLSLHALDNVKDNLFVGKETLGPVKNTSKNFAHFLAGWIKYCPDLMVFYAPTINSYKRYQSSSWAPTRLAWSYDNRTAGFRIVGSGKSLRIENRIAGADCNPYLVFAASLASGLRGIEEKLEPPAAFEGNIYEAGDLPTVPKTLKEAAQLFTNSKFARSVFGDDVVDHYAHFYNSEVAAHEKAVTDWERQRYFERI